MITFERGNTFYRGDSFEILPNIKTDSFEMILADPPYNLLPDQIFWLHEQFIRICRGVVVVFAPEKNPWVSPFDQKLYWVKPISTKNTSKNYSRFVEEIFIYGRNVWNDNLHWSNYVNVLVDRVDDISEHVYRKPPSMIERFLKIHTNMGDKVFDPFAGSGVVHDACVALGRHSLSIDKETNRSDALDLFRVELS